jgi:hypothetical protein
VIIPSQNTIKTAAAAGQPTRRECFEDDRGMGFRCPELWNHTVFSKIRHISALHYHKEREKEASDRQQV